MGTEKTFKKEVLERIIKIGIERAFKDNPNFDIKPLIKAILNDYVRKTLVSFIQVKGMNDYRREYSFTSYEASAAIYDNFGDWTSSYITVKIIIDYIDVLNRKIIVTPSVELHLKNLIGHNTFKIIKRKFKAINRDVVRKKNLIIDFNNYTSIINKISGVMLSRKRFI